MKKIVKKYLKLVKTNKSIILVFIIFMFELFLRFYQMDQKNPFGYDQVDNAWAAQNIIVNHIFPLVGMAAKGNSGIYIGPLYYYLIAIFYWITNLNPIASGIFAGVTSIFTFWTIFYVARKLFSFEVAIISVFINTFLLLAIIFDRVQWPVNLLPGMSLLFFYFLYKVLTENSKNIIFMVSLMGFSFSIHFTAVFFPIMILLALPLFPLNKATLKYSLISIPLFLLLLVPNVLYQLQQSSSGSPVFSYLGTYFHGFHLRRVIQLAGDGLIQFNPYLFFDQLAQLKFIAFPLFFFLYLYKSVSREKLVFCYLVLLWFIVPWLAFSTYSGEISDYYFSINRFLALLIVAYSIFKLWSINNLLPKVLITLLFVYLASSNFNSFIQHKDTGLEVRESAVLAKIKYGEKIKFQVGVPESYLYYYFMRQKGINVY